MLTIKIDTDNQAFEDKKELEIEKCLNDVVSLLLRGYTDNNIHDTNGNICGHFKLTK